jgi:hypothetical protein
VLGSIAFVLVGSAVWAWSTMNQGRAIAATISSCAVESHQAGATKDAFNQCMSRHGLDDELLAATCAHGPDVSRTHSGTSEWANAMAGCINKHGGHATIARQDDLTTGAITYSVRWPKTSVTIGASNTDGNVTTGTSVTENHASSAP